MGWLGDLFDSIFGKGAPLYPGSVEQPAVDPYLSATEISRARLFIPTYQRALARVFNADAIAHWPILAAIHYRENSLLDHSKRIGGAFQYDGGGNGMEQRVANIRAKVSEVCTKLGMVIGDIEQDFQLAAIVAAFELRGKQRIPIFVGRRVDENALADALWGYNGRSAFHTRDGAHSSEQSASSWMFSPYVSNDPHRGIVYMLRGTEPGPAGETLHVLKPDTRPGAMIVYRELLARSAELA